MTESPWHRLLRGGAWYSYLCDCRSAACRDHEQPRYAFNSIGFRIACPAPTDHTVPLEDRHG